MISTRKVSTRITSLLKTTMIILVEHYWVKLRLIANQNNNQVILLQLAYMLLPISIIGYVIIFCHFNNDVITTRNETGIEISKPTFLMNNMNCHRVYESILHT